MAVSEELMAKRNPAQSTVGNGTAALEEGGEAGGAPAAALEEGGEVPSTFPCSLHPSEQSDQPSSSGLLGKLWANILCDVSKNEMQI